MRHFDYSSEYQHPKSALFGRLQKTLVKFRGGFYFNTIEALAILARKVFPQLQVRTENPDGCKVGQEL